MKKMLLISAFPPSKFSAGQSYTMNLIEDLSSHFEIDLIYFDYEDQNYTPSNSRIRVLKRIALSPFLRLINFLFAPFFHPLFANRFSIRNLINIRRIVKSKQYDIIYFDFSQVFLYGLFFRKQRKILMVHDVILQKTKRSGTWMESIWVKWNERILFNMPNAEILTFSSKDSHLISEVYGKNGRVVNFYIDPIIRDLKNSDIEIEDYFVFYGAWNRPENAEGLLWFFDKVLPYVVRRKFIIIGPHLSIQLQEVAARNNVQYLGFVENPYVIIARATALIAPLFKGAGVKVKVIESLACGTSVIGTSVSSEGISSTFLPYIQECHTAEDFINFIVDFKVTLSDKLELKKLFFEQYLPSKDYLLKLLYDQHT